MTEPRLVLVTRPQPGAGETAARLAARGLVPILAPMLEIVPLAGPPLPATDAILLTSRNGLLALGRIDRPVFAVGTATAAAARAAGAAEVASAGGNARDLADLVRARLPPGASLVLPTAPGQGFALSAALRAAGYEVRVHPAYESRPVATLPLGASDALHAGRIGFALFFSAETARAFVAAVRRAGLQAAVGCVTAAAISAPVEVALRALAWRRLCVADRPNQDALLALIE